MYNVEIRKADQLFESERRGALTIINFEKFVAFFATNYEKYVGVRDNTSTTLEEEVGTVMRLAEKAYMADAVDTFNYYSRKAFSIVETTDIERKCRAAKLYKAAAKKILFLSSKCREACEDNLGFVKKKIDVTNQEEVKALVEAFEWVVTHVEYLLQK